MNYVKEFAILCLCLFLGSITRKFINFPIPEPVYGMIYLFLALYFKIIKVESIKKTSDGLLQNLALLFVPVGVGIMASFDYIRGKVLIIVVMVVILTGLTMAFTGIIVQALQKRRKDVRK